MSFPPLHLLVPPFVALVPFALWVRDLPADGDGPGAAIRGGLLLGILYFGILFYWMVVALIWFTKLAIAAYLGSILVLTGLAALMGWALHRAVHRAGVPLWLALPLVWTAGEWLRGHWGDLSFPWLGLGHSLTGFPVLVGIAELVGGRGITFWIALVNGVVAGAILAWREGRRPIWQGLALVLLLAGPAGWGAWRASTLELRPAAEVAVVQPNIPEHLKLDREAAVDSTLASLDRLMDRVEPGSVDLVVWPEVTFPTWIAHPEQEVEGGWRGRFPRRPGLGERVRRFSREAGAPVLFGALGFRFRDRGGTDRFNSAFLMGPEGLRDFHYGKHFLVPFVERVPFIDPDFLGAAERFRYFGGYAPGPEWSLGRVDGARFGVLVCYESSFPSAARALRREGADFLVNITNDAWYGREPWYARTTALWQHPAHLVMRAIEHRVGVARSANTGISLFVDPVGRISGATPLFEPELRTGTVLTTDVATWYTRYGDVAGTGAIVATLLVLGWGRIRRRRRG